MKRINFMERREQATAINHDAFETNCEKDDFNFTTGQLSPVDSYQARAQIVNAPSSKACFVKAAIKGWCQKT